MNILGISALYHDSAAALIRDGEIIAATQEERFTRIKHDSSIPVNAVNYCLHEGNIKEEDLDAVVFYDKPILKFTRILETYLDFAPCGLSSFMKAFPTWLNKKLYVSREIDRGLKGKYKGDIYFTYHHESHAGSAFFPSPFEEAAIITSDGVGEWTTTSWGVGSKNRIELKQEIRFPHSLGLLYSAFTYYLGFVVNSGEYKIMGLAPYSNYPEASKYADLMMTRIIDIKADGSFWLDQSYFNYCAGLTMTSNKFHRLFGGMPRQPESELTQREMNLAGAIQIVTEKIMLRIAEYVYSQTKQENLCLAGGVALNCVANGRLLRESKFKKIWIQPAAGDAGGALGASLFFWHHVLNQPRKIYSPDSMKGSFLGNAYSNQNVKEYLNKVNAVFNSFQDEDDLAENVATLVAAGKIVGLFHGRMEFGPRALGNRSIIADPRDPNMQRKINLKIKFRESFRPFAPACTTENVSDYFETDVASPYMLFVSNVKKQRCLQPDSNDNRSGIDRLNSSRSDIPSVTHVDYSARVQTVAPETNHFFYKTIMAFERLTGYSVIINTSFNIRGEPIVCTPEDAYKCFMYTDMDALVVENCMCLKENQPAFPATAEYKKTVALD